MKFQLDFHENINPFYDLMKTILNIISIYIIRIFDATSRYLCMMIINQNSFLMDLINMIIIGNIENTIFSKITIFNKSLIKKEEEINEPNHYRQNIYCIKRIRN